ncbi:hypothetical protein [Aquiflexum gelatinilyticum]|uniref:hypothetical protein n=1 Tax=Aquiflexum gelatinilyticum TaxID=2961943 RepID=UPI002168DC4A|nr:hypothetical protein [Aquiflexum gelatinilyticum]MCS4434210.1 hypothetical protein [Aquiflexum gelatinilyticum]
MEEFKSVTFARQVIVDANLTNVGDKIGRQNSPMDFTINSKINFLKSKLETSDSKISDFENDEVIKEYFVMPNRFESKFMINDLRFSKNYSTVLQSWKGVVIEINEGSFVGELEDLTLGGTKEIADFDLDTVSPDDKKLVQLGAAFYWNVGYRMTNGQITKESLIRFQRLIDWDLDDYNIAADRASELFENLIFE